MNGIVIKQIDNGQSINFDEVVAFAKKLFANKISIEKDEIYVMIISSFFVCRHSTDDFT